MQGVLAFRNAGFDFWHVVDILHRLRACRATTTFHLQLSRPDVHPLRTWTVASDVGAQKFKSNETQSGGAGADEGEDGEGPVDAQHAWDFMQGKLSTLIWEDGIRLVAGGDDNNQSGNAIIPDGFPGSGSSIPGGPGVRGSRGPPSRDEDTGTPATGTANAANTGMSNPAKSTSAKSKKSKTSTHNQDRANLMSKAHRVLDHLANSCHEEAMRTDPVYAEVEAGRAKDSYVEQLLDDIERLQGKVDSAKSDKLQERFERLLAAAEERLAAVEGNTSRDEAAATSTAAGAAP